MHDITFAVEQELLQQLQTLESEKSSESQKMTGKLSSLETNVQALTAERDQVCVLTVA